MQRAIYIESMKAGEIYSYEDPREILVHIFQEKKTHNPLFSLRAWARRLGFKNPSYLSDVLNGRRKLKIELALKLSDFLGLSNDERRFFEALVFLSNAKTEAEQEFYRTVIDRFKPEAQRREVTPEWYTQLKHWYYGVLDEMVHLKDFQEDYNYLAKRLSPELTPQAVEVAMKEILRMGLIERDKQNQLKRAKKWVIKEEESHSQTAYGPVRAYKKKFIEKGVRALDEQTEEESFYRQTNIPVRQSDFEKLKELADTFFNGVYNLQANKADDVFHVGVLTYRVTQPLLKPEVKR